MTPKHLAVICHLNRFKAINISRENKFQVGSVCAWFSRYMGETFALSGLDHNASSSGDFGRFAFAFLLFFDYVQPCDYGNFCHSFPDQNYAIHRQPRCPQKPYEVMN